MRNLLAIALAGLGLGAVAAEDPSVLSRRGNPPDATLAYGAHADQVIDVRRGKRGAELPLVVLVHGGFWRPQYDRVHTEAMSTALTQEGWTVASIEYRRVPGDPDAMLDDVAAALKAAAGKAAPHNGEVVIIGHSAGGHLVLWAAAKRVIPLRGVVALAPVADLVQAEAKHLGRDAVRDFLGKAAGERTDIDPMRLPAPQAPVTIVQGAGDGIVPPAIAESYCKAFPATRCVTVPDAGHFALIDPQSAAWARVVAELRRLSGASR